MSSDRFAHAMMGDWSGIDAKLLAELLPRFVLAGRRLQDFAGLHARIVDGPTFWCGRLPNGKASPIRHGSEGMSLAEASRLLGDLLGSFGSKDHAVVWPVGADHPDERQIVHPTVILAAEEAVEPFPGALHAAAEELAGPEDCAVYAGVDRRRKRHWLIATEFGRVESDESLEACVAIAARTIKRRYLFAIEYGVPPAVVADIVDAAAHIFTCNERACNGDKLDGSEEPDTNRKSENSRQWGERRYGFERVLLALTKAYGFTDVQYCGLAPTLKRGSKSVDVPF